MKPYFRPVGSNYRPMHYISVKKDAYNEGYDRIFGKKETEEAGEALSEESPESHKICYSNIGEGSTEHSEE